MATKSAPTLGGRVWKLAGRQHGMVSRQQLLALGFRSDAIRHRVANGRLHPKFRGVYAVGSPHITKRGWWMGAILRGGDGAFLSHFTAAELWEVIDHQRSRIHVSVPRGACPRCSSLRIHRRCGLSSTEIIAVDGIPVTAPARTLLDLATMVGPAELEACINQADKRGLIDPVELRFYVATKGGEAGVRALRKILDQRTFRLTDSELERRFLRLVRHAGMDTPETGVHLNGFKTDFYWPDLGLVVETDGLRYHRTAAQQARDRSRDQAHSAAGLTPLRFTHAQVRFESASVIATLRAVSTRLRERTLAPFWGS